jgi:deoxyribonuclease-4
MDAVELHRDPPCASRGAYHRVAILARMRLGAHQSIAGGLFRAIAAARRDGCEAVQIFTHSQMQWRVPPLLPDAIARFRAAVAAWGVPRDRILVHDSYLINVAARERGLRARSLRALAVELDRCAALGIPWLVMHPGAHMGRGEPAGIERAAAAIREALDRTADGPERASILLENTAGQGSALGFRLEHLRDLAAKIDRPARIGVCLDTQHLFAAGYDIASEEGYARTFEAVERTLGLACVRAFHLNDSKRPLGARVDRHERIGRGHIGRDCFRRLVNDPRFADVAAVLELPPPYPPQLAALRRMSLGEATARCRPL